MAELELSSIDVEPVETEDTFYFVFRGGIQFNDRPLDAPGHARLLTASSLYGLTFFSDLSGTWCGRSAQDQCGI